MIGTKNVKTNSGTGVSQYIGPGNHELMFTGFEIKESSNSGRGLLKMHVETRPVTEDGFTPSENSKNGGKVGYVDLGIYAKEGDSAFDERISNLALIAEKLGVRDQVDNISANNMTEFMNSYMNIVRGRFANYLVGGTEYSRTDSEGNNTVGIALRFPRFGFVASLDEGMSKIATYDADNKYHLQKIEESKSSDTSGTEYSTSASDWDDNPF